MSARKPPPGKEQRHSSKHALNTSWRKTALAFSENLNNNAGILHLHKVVDRPEACMCGRSLVWSRTSACHADDPGSNLGDRTKLPFYSLSQRYLVNLSVKTALLIVLSGFQVF